MAGFPQVVWLPLAALLLLGKPVSAQIKFGDFSTNLDGNISMGYTADFGNLTSSDHNWAVGGVANFSGSFYRPSFLSFNANVYLNQSRANSNFQSISNASGFNLTANLFSGSRFPGRIGYSKAYNSEGNYAVPGLANYVTHGDSDAFSVSWNERIADRPSLSFGYQLGSSQYSVYGSNDEGKNNSHELNLSSSYRWKATDMSAYFTDGGSKSLIPEVVSGAQNTETHSGNSSYGFNASHQLPLHGAITAGVNRSEYSSDYLGNGTTGAIDLFDATASTRPNNRLSLSANVNYSDNLTGQLIESVVSVGGVAPEQNSNLSSNSLDLVGTLAYSPLGGLQTSVYAERRSQSYEGSSYGDESYGASVSYGHRVPEGHINAVLNVTENTSDQNGENVLGFSTIENYHTRILGWNVNGAFSYAQNVQTLLITYMSSNYNYNGTVGRHWGKLNVNLSAAAGRTGLSNEPGTASGNENYSATVGYSPWLTASGSYSRSSGHALETGTGLVPITPPILPSSLVSLYGGDGYSLGLGSSPVRNLTLSASYSKSSDNTSVESVSSSNQTNEFNSLIQYQARKIYFTSGYSRLGQGFSASGTPAQTISSFFVGLSRWFNFF